MRDDVKQLIETYQVKMFGNIKHFEAMEQEIRPDEKLLYFANANIKIRARDNSKKESFPGTLFISDLRIVFRHDVGDADVREFLLLDLNSVASRGNGVSGGHLSFASDTERADFLTSYKKEIFEKIEAVLNQAIDNAVRNYNENKAVYDPKGEYSVAACPGCGARNILRQGDTRPCAYCGRMQGEAKPPAPDPGAVGTPVQCPGCGATNIVKKGVIAACPYCGQPQKVE